MTCSTAVIADDEPLLLCALRLQLQQLWPELQIVGAAANGIDALRLLGELQPDVAFLDIKMPGLSGLDVALAARTTHVVFVTAYDQYAVEAFDKQAVDYLLKPVNEQRLGKTIARLQQKLAPATNAPNTAPAKEWLRWIRAGSGNDVGDELGHIQSGTSSTSTTSAISTPPTNIPRWSRPPATSSSACRSANCRRNWIRHASGKSTAPPLSGSMPSPAPAATTAAVSRSH